VAAKRKQTTDNQQESTENQSNTEDTKSTENKSTDNQSTDQSTESQSTDQLSKFKMMQAPELDYSLHTFSEVSYDVVGHVLRPVATLGGLATESFLCMTEIVREWRLVRHATFMPKVKLEVTKVYTQQDKLLKKLETPKEVEDKVEKAMKEIKDLLS